MRVGKLDSGGAPDPGASNLYITDALIQVQSSYEIETGEEFIQKNACGAICQTFKEQDKLKRVTLSLQLCQFDYELLGLMLDATVITGNLVTPGGAIGIDLPASTAPASNGVSLEVWTKAWDGGQAAVSSGGDPLYHHFVWPKTTWVPGQRTIEAGIWSFRLTASARRTAPLATDLLTTFRFGDHRAELVFLDDQIPTAECATTNWWLRKRRSAIRLRESIHVRTCGHFRWRSNGGRWRLRAGRHRGRAV
jgi:hypothetical protein